jgi:pSer/pThr/pTyr-binding forkhead associated (FHA) protein
MESAMVQDNHESTHMMPTGSPSDNQTMLANTVSVETAQTQMGISLVCPVCQTFNSGLETYCSECGFLLTSVPGTLEGHPLAETVGPELVEATSGRRFRLYPGENIIGRENCDILLMEGTVSRRHAKIIVEAGSVTIIDLGSTNGTKVDGNRIEPNQPFLLPAGATISCGNAKLTFSMPGVSLPSDRTLAVSESTAPAIEAKELAEAGPDQTLLGPSETAVKEQTPSETPTDEVVTEEVTSEKPGRILTPPPDEQIELPIARLKPLVDNRKTITLFLGTTTIGRRTGNTVVVSNDPYISGRHAEIICDSTGCYLMDVGSTNGTLVNGTKLEPGIKQLLLDGDEITMGQSTYLFQTLGLPQEADEEKDKGSAPPGTQNESEPHVVDAIANGKDTPPSSIEGTESSLAEDK